MFTDIEFMEIRYSGKVAAVLRGFRSIYVGIFMNAIIMGWVVGAIIKVLQVTVLAGTSWADGGASWPLIIGLLASSRPKT